MRKHMGQQGPSTILWDFEGTLAERPGMWSGTLMQILDENEPYHSIQIEQIRPYMRQGFPWHQPDVPHPELSDPAAWWTMVESIFVRTYQALGLSRQRAIELSRMAHERMIDPRGFRLYDDTLAVLEYLAARGWNHIILSNHVPELAQIVSGIGLDRLIKKCISSAIIGYEKPHPEAFRIALTAAKNPANVWMIGDNPVADVAGAEAVGIPAILVRGPRPDGIRYYAADLWGAVKIIESLHVHGE